MPTKVLDVLDHKTTGLLTIGKILQRIEIGYKFLDANDNPLSPDEFEINGGTHRTIAILLAYALSGHQINLEDVLDIQVSVIPMEYSVEAIVSSNGSRAMTPTEKDWVDLSSGNIDRDVDSIAKAIVDGKRTSTVGFRTALACLAEIDPESILTLDTVGRSGAALYKKLVENRYKVPSNAADLSELLRFAYAKGIPLGINSCKSKNVTNISKNGITYLVDKMYAVLANNTPDGFKAHLAAIKAAAKEAALLANEEVEPDATEEEVPTTKKTAAQKKAEKAAKAASKAVKDAVAAGAPLVEVESDLPASELSEEIEVTV